MTLPICPQIWGYARTSTIDQEYGLEAQQRQLLSAGVPADNIFIEQISGSVPGPERAILRKLLETIQPGDTLIVTKVDRLGRDTIDILSTTKKLRETKVTVRFLDIGTIDGTVGEIILTVMAAIAQGERTRNIERTKDGLQAAIRRGVKLGRKFALNKTQQQEVFRKLSLGVPVAEIARLFNVHKATIYRFKRKYKLPEALPLEALCKTNTQDY